MFPGRKYIDGKFYGYFRNLLFLSVIVSVGYYAVYSLNAFPDVKVSINWYLIALSALFSLAGHLFNAAVWHVIARECGLLMPWRGAFSAWFASRLGRYVPGKVAWFLSRLDSYKVYSAKQVGLASGLEIIISIGVAGLLIFAFSILNPGVVLGEWRNVLAILSAFICLIVFTPLLSFMIAFINKTGVVTIDRQVPGFLPRVVIVALGFLAVICHGGSLYFLVNALTDISWSHYPAITVFYYLAGQIGMLAFFSPGGLGVREGALIVMLETILPSTIVIYSAFGIRLINLITELLGFLVFWRK